MGRSVKKILVFCLAICTILIMLSALYVFDTLNEAGDRLSKSLIGHNESPKNINMQQEYIEALSTFKKSDFLYYTLFSKELRTSSGLLDSYIENKKVKRSKSGHFVANVDIPIEPLEKNHCDIVYCYQHKMSFSKIPSKFWKGLMGIEDYRFLNHFGIDFISILRAIITDIKAMKLVQGGSTLTQQLVKNLYFSNKKTFTRKIKEIIIAIYLERKYEKEDILESYFNEVFWGSYKGIRIKGVYAASLIYFGKRPRQITSFETAILISMLKGPGHYSPIKNLRRIRKRSKMIFSKLLSLGLISKNDGDMWNDEQFESWQKWLLRPSGKLYLDTIWRVSKKDDKSILSNFEEFKLVLSAKEIEQNIKLKYIDHDISTKIYMKKISDSDTSNEGNSFKFYSKYERSQDVAILSERHQVGSTLKPIIYNIYKSLGHALDEQISTKKITLKLKSGPWSPRESHVVKEDKVTLKNALLQSLNRPLIRLGDEIGFDKVEQEILPYLKNLKRPLNEYPSQLLGSIELSLSELWNAYALFIDKSCKLVLSDGEETELFEDTIMNHLSNPMTTTIKNVVSKELKNMKFFGKTGTSNNGYDNWYVFFDGVYLGVIWTGVEGDRNLNEKLRLYGSTTSFLIYQKYLLGRGKLLNELNCDEYVRKIKKRVN